MPHLELQPGQAAKRHKLREYIEAGVESLVFLLKKERCPVRCSAPLGMICCTRSEASPPHRRKSPPSLAFRMRPQVQFSKLLSPPVYPVPPPPVIHRSPLLPPAILHDTTGKCLCRRGTARFHPSTRRFLGRRCPSSLFFIPTLTLRLQHLPSQVQLLKLPRPQADLPVAPQRHPGPRPRRAAELLCWRLLVPAHSTIPRSAPPLGLGAGSPD